MSHCILQEAKPSRAGHREPRWLSGSLTALVTPFAPGASRLNERAFAGLVEWQVEDGTDGLVVARTTGEAPMLTATEHDRLIRVAVGAAAGRVPVIAGTGTNCTRSSIELTRAAQAACFGIGTRDKPGTGQARPVPTAFRTGSGPAAAPRTAFVSDRRSCREGARSRVGQGRRRCLRGARADGLRGPTV